MARKSTRTITVGTRVWKYRIGHLYCVAKAQDTGEGRRINLSALTGLSWNSIERMIWKSRNFHVTPKHVATWLATRETT